MTENKKTVRGFLKKGFVFCMIGVMAFGMAACGGNKTKKSTPEEADTKIESNQSADMQAGNETDKKDDGNTGSNQKKSSAESANKKGTAKSSKSNKKSTGMQKSNKSSSAAKNKKNN